MRIISGKYKGRRLFPVPGNTSRPTTDFLKEAVFSIIANCKNKIVLDLFAGSGGLGLEALSRGADFVDFVDFSQKAIKTQIMNVEKLNCSDSCKINRKKVNAFIKDTEKEFDLIFMDPPYNKNLVNAVIEKIYDFERLSEGGMIVIEHSKRELIEDEWLQYVLHQKKYGKSILTILGRRINENI